MTDAKDVTQVLGSDSNFLGPLFAAEQQRNRPGSIS